MCIQIRVRSTNLTILRKIFFGLSLILFIAACSSRKTVIAPKPEPTGVQFMQSDKLMPVLEVAKTENKLVFVDFYTTWCLPCKLMDEDVFTDKELSKFLNANFINYKVDAEKGNGANLSVLYQIIAYPTLLFLDAEGNVLTRKIGAAYQTELRQLAEEAIATSKNTGE